MTCELKLSGSNPTRGSFYFIIFSHHGFDKAHFVIEFLLFIHVSIILQVTLKQKSSSCFSKTWLKIPKTDFLTTSRQYRTLLYLKFEQNIELN